MPNIDLMSILPLLAGGKNPDMAQLLAAMGKTPPASPAAAPPPPTNPNNRADYAKLYPHTPINDLPRADRPASGPQPAPQNGPPGTDMNNLFQMMAALNAAKKQSAPPPPPNPPPVAPTAPREIQDSLRAILTLNELSGETPRASR